MYNLEGYPWFDGKHAKVTPLPHEEKNMTVLDKWIGDLDKV